MSIQSTLSSLVYYFANTIFIYRLVEFKMDGPNLEWLPPFFKDASANELYVKGFVTSDEELTSLIELHRKKYLCGFVFG